MGSLYVVATPIGNLEDITLRALKVLKEVSFIAAEDTRHTKKLLAHYGITTKLTSYFEHNEKEKAPFLIERLKSGEDVALVSDAGTPGISDPGYRLIRLAIESSIPVVAIPGPSALVTVLSVAGLPLDSFTFKGFAPSKDSERKRFFLSMKGAGATFAFFESPRRLKDTLEAIREVLGDSELTIAREMTKIHEEVLRGRAGELLEKIRDRDLKGELTVVLRVEREEAGEGAVRKEIERLLKEGFKLKEVARAVSQEFDLPGGEAYKEALKVKEEMGL